MDREPTVRQSIGPKPLFNPTFIDRERDAQSLAPKRPARRAATLKPTIVDNSSSDEDEDPELDSDDEEYNAYQSYLKNDNIHAETAPDPSHVRVKGGRAAVTKRINIDLDSDDEIIKTMKDQGYRDVDVQRRLVSEGRTKYAEKSITTRYNRIVRALNENETKVLDEELTDWHDGDDEVLDGARKKFKTMYDRAMHRAESNYWLNVSKDVHEQQLAKGQTKRFSRNACRDRALARDAGTALPPLESDPDQEGRLAAYNKRKAEIAALKAATEEQRRAKDEEALRKYYEEMDVEKEKRHKHLTKKELKEINDAIRNKRDADRAERVRVKTEAAEGRKAQKAVRAEENRRKQAEKVDNRRARAQAIEDKREDAKLERARGKMELEMKQLTRLQDEVKEKFAKQQDKREVTGTIRRIMHARLDEIDKASGLTGVKRARLGANVVKEDSAVIISHLRNPHPRASMNPFVKLEDKDGKRSPSVTGLTNTGNIQDRSFMTDPRANPRGFMTEPELIAVCEMRGVPHKSKLKRQLVQALMSSDNQLKSRQLQDVLRSRNLPIYGDKATLIWRVSNDDAGKLAKGSDMHIQIQEKAKAYAHAVERVSSADTVGASDEDDDGNSSPVDPSLLASDDDGSEGDAEEDGGIPIELSSSEDEQPVVKKAKFSSK